MKRGFLNKPPKSRTSSRSMRADNDVPAEPVSTRPPESEPPDSDPEEDAVEEGNEPAFNGHRAPEWMIKQNKKGETRFVFREWPRDPNGKDAFQIEPGKTTSNGIEQWGATLYDFFTFYPVPGSRNLLSTATSSRLAATMRRLGELEASKSELAWADAEEAPRQLVLPVEIARDILSVEELSSIVNGGGCKILGGTGAGPKFVRGPEHAGATEVPLQESDPDEYPDIADITPENYPWPWPTVPFTSEPPPPKLETLIPYSLLPKKLIVHDPWNLLSMSESDDLETQTDETETKADWTQKPDIIRTYELAPLTEAGRRKLDHQHEVFRTRIDEEPFIMPSTDTDEIPGDATEAPCAPWLKINIPPYPHKKATPAAHLYISPASKVGVGHHSAVYNVEWELPRSLLVPDEFCMECALQPVTQMKASGRLDALIAEAAASDPPGHITQRVEIIPERVVDVSERSRPGCTDESVKPDIRIVAPKTIERTRVYDGPFVDLDSKLQWQTPGRGKNCVHLQRRSPFGGPECMRPPTATVRVCAKLSIQDDRHLEREAKVYQAFPSHFSEHWNGYNIVRPARAPVPVGAVVPQYYGYYVPAAGERGAESGYLSPIMLLENCGTPLDAEALSADEKTECWSLVYRMHHADWIHESVAARNIVMQKGPLTQPQGWMRGWKGDGGPLSFRVIDFGRSLYCGPEAEEGTEDVYRELRAPGNGDDRIRYERAEVDKLLSQGYMFH